MENVQVTPAIITKQQLLNHWQGHRGLTRRVIEAFPEKDLFEFTIGGMRPFILLSMEVTDLARGVKGMATGEWGTLQNHDSADTLPKSKEELLALWDDTTAFINTYFAQIKEEDFGKEIMAFGSWPGTILSTALYFIDNEIHHRGQGYVYLRALGITPPGFYERPQI